MMPTKPSQINFKKVSSLMSNFKKNKSYYDVLLKKDEISAIYNAYSFLIKLVPSKKTLFDEGNVVFFKKFNRIIEEIKYKNDKFIEELKSLTSY